jgi:hypothetical protein
VGEVGEKTIAEGVVAEVLDGTASVGISVCLAEVVFGKVGILFEEDGADGLLPGEVDELFVGLNRVGDAGRGGEQKS